jgi:hypothetical protein
MQSYIVTDEARRSFRKQVRADRDKSGPVVDPRRITEPPSTVAQRSLIQRLRRILSVIPSQHPVKGWLREGHLMPSTNREAERLIENLYRQINKRLAKLPEDQRSRYKVPSRVA